MKREDFEKLKEKEKAHLREIQKLKSRLKEAERARSIGKALGDVEASRSTQDFDEALARVQLEALEGEARLDFAIDSQSERTGRTPDLEESEEALAKARAAELVRHMKISMGLSEEEAVKRIKGATKAAATKAGDEDHDSSSASSESPQPTKTIGRRQPKNE